MCRLIKTKTTRVILTAAIIIAIMLMITTYLALQDYPRIIRSAYYRNPIYAFKVLAAEYLTNKKVSKSEAMAKVEEVGLTPVYSPKFLCLLNEPDERIDHPVIQRYFVTLSSVPIRIDSTIFWQVPVEQGFVLVEADTGSAILFDLDLNGTHAKYYTAE